MPSAPALPSMAMSTCELPRQTAGTRAPRVKCVVERVKRRRAALTLVTMVATACAGRSPRTVESPVLGSQMPCVPVKDTQYAISPSQFAVGCEVVTHGIVFFVASVDGERVAFVSTKDAGFSTPEGVRVGSTRSEVQKLGGGEVVDIRGWAYVVDLPSGWSAHFPGAPGIMDGIVGPQSPVTKLSRDRR